MKLFKSLKICFLVIFLTTPLFSLAQFKFEIKPFLSYFGDLSRYEFGGSATMGFGTLNGVVPVYGYNNYFIGDSTLKKGIVSKPGFGASVGLTAPFAATGHISIWAFSIHLTVNQYEYDNLNPTYDITGSFKDPVKPLNATVLQFGLPIGVDWKVGCDAIQTKRLPFGAAFGVGITPHFNVTSLNDENKLVLPQQSIGFNPYVKAEGAVFAGLCVRLRLMYSMGNVELMNTEKSVPLTGYNDGKFNLTNNSQFTASLLFMLFSGRWHESAWYNDYDSYNWNEKLN